MLFDVAMAAACDASRVFQAFTYDVDVTFILLSFLFVSRVLTGCTTCLTGSTTCLTGCPLPRHSRCDVTTNIQRFHTKSTHKQCGRPSDENPGGRHVTATSRHPRHVNVRNALSARCQSKGLKPNVVLPLTMPTRRKSDVAHQLRQRQLDVSD